MGEVCQWTDLGAALPSLDAYYRGLPDYGLMCCICACAMWPVVLSCVVAWWASPELGWSLALVSGGQLALVQEQPNMIPKN